MISHISTQEVITKIVMTRTASEGAIVLVEGPSDRRVFKSILAQQCCVFSCKGWETLVEILRIIECEKIPGVIGIADSDFSRCGLGPREAPGLFLTDGHDLETMIILSPALDRLLEEYASTDKIRAALEKEQVSHVREILLERSSKIGKVRFQAMYLELRIGFDGINYKKVISKETIDVDIKKYLNQLQNVNADAADDLNKLRQSLDKIPKSREEDLHEYTVGSELVEILCRGLRKALGTQPAKVTSSENMSRILRLTYSSEDFSLSKLYKDLHNWELESQRFTLTRSSNR